jgi:hypothetical protein
MDGCVQPCPARVVISCWAKTWRTIAETSLLELTGLRRRSSGGSNATISAEKQCHLLRHRPLRCRGRGKEVEMKPFANHGTWSMQRSWST